MGSLLTGFEMRPGTAMTAGGSNPTGKFHPARGARTERLTATHQVLRSRKHPVFVLIAETLHLGQAAQIGVRVVEDRPAVPVHPGVVEQRRSPLG